MSQRIHFLNRPDTAQSSDTLYDEFRKITSVDTDRQFRFIVRFVSSGGHLNNFKCKVYPWCTDDEEECLGILQRGDVAKMRQIKKQFNEC